MSIGENISYGASGEVTTEQIIEAAQKANAYRFISEFPDGFSTLVGERGQMLSGKRQIHLGHTYIDLKVSTSSNLIAVYMVELSNYSFV